MPQTRTIQNLIFPQGGANPQALAQAGQEAVQRATAPSGPYSSRPAGLLKSIQAGLGGMMEGAAERQIKTGQQQSLSQMLALADALPQGQGGGTPAPTSTVAPQGGIGSDHVAGRGPSDFLGRLGQIESGGQDAISNKASGATGRYQFIASTWGNLAKRYPELGLTPDGRIDPAQQGRAIQAFTNENASALGRAGFQATPGNLYLAHFAGAGGATSALRADPSTPVEQIMGAAAVRANPFLRGRTAGDLVAWANGKMAGVDPNTVPGSSPAPASAAAGAGSSPIGDGAALAAETRLKNGTGTDADRALRAAYLGQQNAPPPGRSAAADMPVPNAHPVGMQGLPPGITPEVWAASQGPGADLHRFDEVPAGTQPYVPGQGGPQNSPLAAAILAHVSQGSTEPAAMPDPAPAAAAAPTPPAATGDAVEQDGSMTLAGDASLRDQIEAAWDQQETGGAPAPMQAALPDNPPLPPEGGPQTRQAVADAEPAAEPTLRQTIEAAMDGPEPTAATPPAAAAPSPAGSPSPFLPLADPSLPTPRELVAGDGSSRFALNELSPAYMRGLAAALSGPLPGMQAAPRAMPGPNPDAPAPRAVPAGPAPVAGSPVAAALPPAVPSAPSDGGMVAPQPGGLPGRGGGDPSSAQSFQRQEAARAGRGPTPGGLMASIGDLLGPGSIARGGSGLMLGVPPQAGRAPAGGSAPLPSPMQGGAPSTPSTPSAEMTQGPSPASAPTAAAAPGGPSSQAREIAKQILSNEYSSPAAQQMAIKVLFPEPQELQSITRPDGSTMTFNSRTGVYTPGAPAVTKPTETYRPATAEERRLYGVPDGRPMTMGSSGKPEFGAIDPNERETPEQRIYAQVVAEAKAKGLPVAPFGQWVTDFKHAGSDDPGPAKDVFNAMKEQHESAAAAATSLSSFQQANAAIKSGAILGAGADQRLGLAKVLGFMGLKSQGDAAADTEVFRASVAPVVLSTVKGLGAGSGISNADRAFAEDAAGGKITLEPGAIQRLLDIGERAARARIAGYNAMLDGVYPAADAKNGQVRQLFQLRGLDTGQAPAGEASGAGAGSVGAPRDVAPGVTGSSAPQSPASGNIPTISNPADAMRLPPGTVFMTPDGRRKVR